MSPSQGETRLSGIDPNACKIQDDFGTLPTESKGKLTASFDPVQIKTTLAIKRSLEKF